MSDPHTIPPDHSEQEIFKKLIPFAYGNHLVRSILIDGIAWFVASDVCKCLGLGNVSTAVKGNKGGNVGLDEDERITIMIHNSNPRAGIPHQMILVNESGLYSLIFKSRKPEARAFRRWVLHEVLPSIRKTGSYLNPALHAAMEKVQLQPHSSTVAAILAGVADLRAILPGASENKILEEIAKAVHIDTHERLRFGLPVSPAHELLEKLEIGKPYTLLEIARIHHEHDKSPRELSGPYLRNFKLLFVEPLIEKKKLLRTSTSNGAEPHYTRPEDDIVSFSSDL